MVEMPSKGSLNTLKFFERLTDHTDKLCVPFMLYFIYCLSKVKNKIDLKGKEIAQQPPLHVFVLMLMRLMCHD